MKYIEKITMSTAVLLSSTAFTIPCAPLPKEPATTEKGFVVLELFTSEGCSSCPAADELMAKLQNEKSDQPRYILSYHVDYWDRLGWRDAFSDPQFSKRQRKYGEWLRDPQIYTPQLVVNGKSVCIGSDEVSIKAIEKEYQTKSTSATLTLRGEQVADKMNLHYEVLGNNDRSELLIATVQKYAITNVKRGENGGRILHHVQVVRSLSTFPVEHDSEGQQSITLPPGFNAKDFEIIAMIQDTRTGEITAATRANLPNTVR
ncbi:DUF1223 domain-containing protein [Pseudochryseolinea flava]|nr:DUF1223 domain-containing protein [Pseudochryseolinea flava]